MLLVFNLNLFCEEMRICYMLRKFQTFVFSHFHYICRRQQSNLCAMKCLLTLNLELHLIVHCQYVFLGVHFLTNPLFTCETLFYFGSWQRQIPEEHCDLWEAADSAWKILRTIFFWLVVFWTYFWLLGEVYVLFIFSITIFKW